MFALILEAFYEQRTSHNVRTLWGALDMYLDLFQMALFYVNGSVYRIVSFQETLA